MNIRITRITCAPLLGESPKGGWSAEIAPEDSIHALIAVHTDSGLIGHGSVFSDGRLVQAALHVLGPLYAGESALEPERVSEKLHQNTFWMGRGGTLTHAISGIDIALWDILGQATGQPVGRLLGGVYRTKVRPYCSLLMDETSRMAAAVAEHRARGFTAYKIGWGPFGRAMNPAQRQALRHGQFSYLRRRPAAWTEKERLEANVSLSMKESALTETAATGIEHNVRVWDCRIRPQAII
jgi:D-galactarolactone cycloisomerase